MSLKVKKQAAIAAGKHTGIIIDCRETQKVFDGAKGPEDVIEVVIQPSWKKDADTETIPVAVSFSPVLNGLSALSKFLARIKREPDGESWEPSSIVGTEVAFTAAIKNDFVNVSKDSIVAR